MRDAVEAERIEIGKSLSGACRIKLSARTKSPKHRGNFQIDELGSAEPLTAQSVTGTSPSVFIVDQSRRQYARVDDYHRVSRSERMARTASAAASLPPV